jgi:hypothetical protein
VLQSAETDERMAAPLRSRVIEFLVMAAIGTGFGTLGLLKLFGAH